MKKRCNSCTSILKDSMEGTETKINAVIGFPLGHTLSPLLHNAFYKKNSIDAEMRAMPGEDIEKLVKVIRVLPICLTAVTIPHKQTIMQYLDETDKTAKDIGAVNTVINRDGKLYGYNTDVVGIAKTLQAVALKNKIVLVIGAGGAAQAVGYYLKEAEAKILCLNRSEDRAKEFVERFGGKVVTAEQVRAQPVDVIINTTPIGMSPKIEESPLPDGILRAGQTVFDIVYNPLETKLLNGAKVAGCNTLSGITMFVEQALEQERLWLGRVVKNEWYEELIIEALKK